MPDFDALRNAVVTIQYRRDGDGWTAETELQEFSATAAGRTLQAARTEVLGILAASVNTAWRKVSGKPNNHILVHAGSIRAVDSVDLPVRARTAVAKALRTRQAARDSAAKAAAALSDAVVALDQAGLSLRDAGEVLELSHARVAQVLDEARAGTREEKP